MEIAGMIISQESTQKEKKPWTDKSFAQFYIQFLILEIIHNYKILTSFKVKILSLHVSIRNSVLGDSETTNGTESIWKEANIQCHSLHSMKWWEWGRSLAWQHFSYADTRCLCPGHWTGVSAASLPLDETYEKEKPRAVASRGQNSATHTKFNSSSLPSFPHSINNGTGLYLHIPKSLLSSIPPYTLAWIQF